MDETIGTSSDITTFHAATTPRVGEPRTRRLLLTSARWLAVVLVFLIAAEVFTRLDDKLTWGARLLSPYNEEYLLRQDSVGFRGRRNFQYQKWRMNNLGFRGPDIAPSPAPGVTRIAVVGASETFGLYESEDHEYPARMQALLDSIAPGRYEVINVGLPGLSLASMVPYVQRAVVPTGASILVIYPTPMFYLEVQPLLVDYVPPRYRPPAVLKFGDWTIEREALMPRIAAKAREVLKGLIPNVVVMEVRQMRLAARRSKHDDGWVWRTVPTDRLQILRTHLDRLLASVNAEGLQPVLVTHANRFAGAMQDTTGPARRLLVNLMSLYYPQATPRVMIDFDSVANAFVRESGASHGAVVVEAERHIPASPSYFADFLHFTDAGADQMARLIVEGILHQPARPLVRAAPAGHQ
jgi:hypothetical protein